MFFLCDPFLNMISIKNDQRHKDQIFQTGIAKSMSASVWRKCDVPGFYRTQIAIIIVFALSGKDIICFTLIVMFMVPK